MNETLTAQLAELAERYHGRPVAMPCLDVVWAPAERTVANDYNPNEMAADGLRYLTLSIAEDGLTQPIVAWYDAAADLYVIVDGFHRYALLRDVWRCNYIPVTLVDLPRAERIVATVLHNRARGKHRVAQTGDLIRRLSALGWADDRIARALALPAEELLRARQARSMAQAHARHPYGRAWVMHEGEPLYGEQTVLNALDERLDWIFDRHARVVVSVSGGKDSTLLFEAAYRKAAERGRGLHAFFLDQEAEYQSTIDVISGIMRREGVVPHWYQVPIRMTNATSAEEDMLFAWEPGAAWLRGKDPLAIHAIDGEYPRRFYPFLNWFEREFARRYGPSACVLIGLRAEESPHRYRTLTRNPGAEGVLWSTAARQGRPVKLYPLYDWGMADVFRYFHDHDITYNRVYDWMHAQGERPARCRVSNLIHEKAYRSLARLQEFEPETYERLIRRLRGTRTAARYAEETMIYSNGERPARFATWREYRDDLLATMPDNGRRPAFERRFACQPQDEAAYRHQCRQLLLGDWENNVRPATRDATREDWRQKWMELL